MEIPRLAYRLHSQNLRGPHVPHRLSESIESNYQYRKHGKKKTTWRRVLLVSRNEVLKSIFIKAFLY